MNTYGTSSLHSAYHIVWHKAHLPVMECNVRMEYTGMSSRQLYSRLLYSRFIRGTPNKSATIKRWKYLLWLIGWIREDFLSELVMVSGKCFQGGWGCLGAPKPTNLDDFIAASPQHLRMISEAISWLYQKILQHRQSNARFKHIDKQEKTLAG